MQLRNLFLGIDLGTTSVKATLIDEEWTVIGQQRVEYQTHQLKPMWVEQDPWEWWVATCQVVQKLLSVTRVKPIQVKAVSVSSQAPTLLGVDREGQPTGNAMIWMDRRAEAECLNLLSLIGDSAIRQISGNRIDPYYMLPKLLWEKKNHNDKYDRTYQYLQANGWIILQLTGRYSIDVSHAALTQLYNIHQNCWDASLMQELDISIDKFPTVFGCKEVVGALTPIAGDALGLSAGTVVIAGAIDGATASLGLKLYENKQAFEMSGQSSGIGIILDQPLFHPNLALLKHALEDKWILKGSMSASGGSLQWFRDQIDQAEGGADVYHHYETLVESVPPGANGLIYLPYLAGERAPLWDSYAKGVFFGLHLQTGKADMIRAIMEGTAYGLKSIVDELQKVNLQVTELFGTGGGYLSAQWSQIKADILEMDIRVASSEIETASLGSAYLALMGYTGIDAYKIPDVKITRTYTPNPNLQQRYRNYYSIFKELYHQNKELFKNLALAGE